MDLFTSRPGQGIVAVDGDEQIAGMEFFSQNVTDVPQRVRIQQVNGQDYFVFWRVGEERAHTRILAADYLGALQQLLGAHQLEQMQRRSDAAQETDPEADRHLDMIEIVRGAVEEARDGADPKEAMSKIDKGMEIYDRANGS